jgi:hypothetical protein
MLLCAAPVFADPSGSSISGATTVTGANSTPAMRNDSKSTITTMILSAVQLDQFWKAYVGNITGIYTLDNPNNATIYSWDATTVTGQVYASRHNNVSWTNIACADRTLMNTEAAYYNMTSGPDRLNATFNWTVHKAFSVGLNAINQSTCNNTVTYVNDTRQVPTTSSPFQEVLIKDATNDYMIYMTSIDDNSYGYDNTTFDFQLIVPESNLAGGSSRPANTAYYFYVELR